MACFSAAIELIDEKTQKIPPNEKPAKHKTRTILGGDRVKFLFRQLAHSKPFHLKAVSSRMHILYNSEPQVQYAFSQACHYPCKLF